MKKKECYQDGASRLDLRYIDNSRPRESKSQANQLDDGDVKKPVPHATENDLQSKIQSLFNNDTNLANYDIRVYCNQRQVELTGIVDALSEKEHAQNLVKKHFDIPVINSISMSTDGHIVDKDVYQELMEELHLRNLSPENLNIEVHNGVVTLMGEKPENFKDIMDAIKTARGVAEVQNLTSLDKKESTLHDYFHSQVNNDLED